MDALVEKEYKDLKVCSFLVKFLNSSNLKKYMLIFKETIKILYC